MLTDAQQLIHVSKLKVAFLGAKFFNLVTKFVPTKGKYQKYFNVHNNDNNVIKWLECLISDPSQLASCVLLFGL